MNEQAMRVVSVNVGLPREVEWRGKKVLTSIFKAPVDRRVRVTRLNLDGDEQSDLTGPRRRRQGGLRLSVRALRLLAPEFPGMDLPWGAFGENLTVEGLLEDKRRIGDRFRMRLGEFVVTQPRMPCFKLGIRFGRPDLLKRFLASRRTGFYFAVLRAGRGWCGRCDRGGAGEK